MLLAMLVILQMCIRDRYLINAQGEDVVAGVRTPSKIDQLKQDMPQVYEQLSLIHISFISS